MVQKNIENSLFLILLACALTLTSCDRSRVFENYREVGSAGWHMDSVMTFHWEPSGEHFRYDGFMALRVNAEYSYQNLYVFVDQKYPNGEGRRDTVNYRLAAPSGALLGKGTGAVKEFRLPIFIGGELPGDGEYSISLTHGMRDTQLVGIEDVGFRLALTSGDS